MIVTRQILVKTNPSWPRYQFICGEVKRLLSPEATTECLIEGEWKPN